MARDLRDEDDWVGTPPEGRHGRERAKPEYWNRRWPAATVAGGLLGILVIVVIVLAVL
jgi:hypothetical protein